MEYKTIKKDNDTFKISTKKLPYIGGEKLSMILWDLDENDYFVSYSFLMYKNEIHSVSKIHKADKCRKLISSTVKT